MHAHSAMTTHILLRPEYGFLERKSMADFLHYMSSHTCETRLSRERPSSHTDGADEVVASEMMSCKPDTEGRTYPPELLGLHSADAVQRRELAARHWQGGLH